MTANDIFDTVLALMFCDATDKVYYEDRFYQILNYKLAESFEQNNAVRQYKGKEPLSTIPTVNSLIAEVAYEEELTRSLLPLGIAADLYSEEDENGITNVYRERYFNGLASQVYAHFVENGGE